MEKDYLIPLKAEVDPSGLNINKVVLLPIKKISDWLINGNAAIEKSRIRKSKKTGCKVLFYGDAVEAKIIAAALIGKEASLPVYKVDLSKLVSKYMGETEKNIAQLFAEATSKNWILFFDEADALFGKRTDVKDAHDRFTNTATHFLLQKIEAYKGLLIVANNLKSSIDTAFLRRLRYTVAFDSTIT